MTAAGAQLSTHACGGTLLHVRESNGHSYERCSGWSYDFDASRARDNVLTVTPARPA